MTPKQRLIYNFIKNKIETIGSSPTYAEISMEIGLVKSRVYKMVNDLVRQNYLQKNNFHRRNLEIVIHYCPHCKGNLAQRINP